MPVISSSIPCVHLNPFGGRCIHGKKGARLERGALVNRKCEHCRKQHGLEEHENQN